MYVTEPYTEESLPSVLASSSQSWAVLPFLISSIMESVDRPSFVHDLFLPVVPFFVLPVEAVAVLPVADVAFANTFDSSVCWLNRWLCSNQLRCIFPYASHLNSLRPSCQTITMFFINIYTYKMVHNLNANTYSQPFEGQHYLEIQMNLNKRKVISILADTTILTLICYILPSFTPSYIHLLRFLPYLLLTFVSYPRLLSLFAAFLCWLCSSSFPLSAASLTSCCIIIPEYVQNSSIIPA